MYSDDFDVKEKAKVGDNNADESNGEFINGLKNLSLGNGKDEICYEGTFIRFNIHLLTGMEQEGENSTAKKSSTEATSEVDDDTVSWELKWSQNETAEVHGPHTTEQMQAWAKEGYFKSGAWVRRNGQQGQFYSAARVDFELYL